MKDTFIYLCLTIQFCVDNVYDKMTSITRYKTIEKFIESNLNLI